MAPRLLHLAALTMLIVAGCGTATTPDPGVSAPSALGRAMAPGEASPGAALAAQVIDGELTISYRVDDRIRHAQAVLLPAEAIQQVVPAVCLSC